MISFVYSASICLFGMESLIAILNAFSAQFVSYVDVDLITVTVFWAIVKVYRELKAKRVHDYIKVDVGF